MSKEKMQAVVLFCLLAVLTFLVYGKTIVEVSSLPGAAKRGSLVAVKLHLMFGADVNAVQPGYKTTLEETLYIWVNPADVHEILNYRPDRTMLVDKGQSLLVMAMRWFDSAKPPLDKTIEVLKLLIEFCEDVNASDGYTTPLFTAVNLNRWDLISFLLAAGADPTLIIELPGSGIERTIFDALNFSKSGEIVEILLKSGKGLNPEAFMQTAIRAQNMEAIRLLAAKGVSLNTPDPRNETVPLMTVAQSFTEAQVKEFVELGADINIVDRFGRNVLATCIQYDKYDLARYFISKGVDVNYVDNFGESLLSYFIDKQVKPKNLDEFMKQMAFLTFLKKKGLNLSHRNPNNGRTAIMQGIMRQNQNFWLRLLIESDEIDNNIQDNEGKTALMYAIERKNIELIEKLLEKTDRSIRDNKGQTALDYAIETDSAALINLLTTGKKQ